LFFLGRGFFFNLFFFGVGIEPRASRMLGKRCTTKLHPSPTCFFFLLLCWGYMVAFTKVLRLYQIYHNWIHPLYHSLLVLLPLIPFLE
jgi:hypothetical protein